MAIVNGYATLPEAKSWIGLKDTLSDPVIEDIVTSVSRWIDDYCCRQFWATTAGTVRYFDSRDGQCVYLDGFDLTTISTLKTDDNDDGVFETTWSASDYQLLPLNIAAPEAMPYREIRTTGTRWFPYTVPGYSWVPRHIGLIEVTGTWGWPAIPAAVKQACRMQVSRIFQRAKSPEGVSGWGEFGVVRVGRLDPDVQTLLAPYRIPVIA